MTKTITTIADLNNAPYSVLVSYMVQHSMGISVSNGLVMAVYHNRRPYTVSELTELGYY